MECPFDPVTTEDPAGMEKSPRQYGPPHLMTLTPTLLRLPKPDDRLWQHRLPDAVLELDDWKNPLPFGSTFQAE